MVARHVLSALPDALGRSASICVRPKVWIGYDAESEEEER